MDIDKAFGKLYEEVEKEASTYRDKAKDEKKKRHFAFGGKKKEKHGKSGYRKGEEVDRKFVEAFGLDERKMTDDEMAEREEIVKKMKPKLQSFKDRYGDDAEKVMYATATKQAMEEVKLDEISMEAGKVYHQDSSDGKMFFKAVEQQKNKRWKGLVLDIGQKKPKSGSADEKLRFWKVTPDKDIPATLKEDVEIDEGKSTYDKEIAAFIAKGGKVKKLSVGKKEIAKAAAEFKKSFKRSEAIMKIELDLEDELKRVRTEEVEIDEAEIANSVGGGGIAGLDIGLTAKKKKEDTDKAKALRKKMVGEEVQRTTFAGKDVFIVDSETYYNCRLGKKKYGRYEKYVGNGEVGQTIREYGLKYPRRPIILQNGDSGPMLYLKYGRS
jgi:hypothetical protein